MCPTEERAGGTGRGERERGRKRRIWGRGWKRVEDRMRERGGTGRRRGGKREPLGLSRWNDNEEEAGGREGREGREKRGEEAAGKLVADFLRISLVGSICSLATLPSLATCSVIWTTIM